MITILPVAALLLATTARLIPVPADVRTETPVREARRISVTLSPDLLWLHAGDLIAAPLALRLGVNLTSRIAVTASGGSMPGLLQIWQFGVRVDALESAFSPYGGIEAGVLDLISDDSPDRSETLVLGVLGMSYVARNGFEVGLEGGAGWEGRSAEAGGNATLLRAGVRLGWRFAI